MIGNLVEFNIMFTWKFLHIQDEQFDSGIPSDPMGWVRPGYVTYFTIYHNSTNGGLRIVMNGAISKGVGSIMAKRCAFNFNRDSQTWFWVRFR